MSSSPITGSRIWNEFHLDEQLPIEDEIEFHLDHVPPELENNFSSSEWPGPLSQHHSLSADGHVAGPLGSAEIAAEPEELSTLEESWAYASNLILFLGEPPFLSENS
jgi:hypothetical protein